MSVREIKRKRKIQDSKWRRIFENNVSGITFLFATFSRSLQIMLIVYLDYESSLISVFLSLVAVAFALYMTSY